MGPFQVLEKISKEEYLLQLPPRSEVQPEIYMKSKENKV
jgi:hypothetical protein